MRNILFSGLLLTTILSLFSCNNDSLVGADVVDGDGIEVVYTDTITIEASTSFGVDSLITKSPTFSIGKLYLGQIEDEFFGSQTYTPYMTPRLNTSRPNFFVEGEYVTVDSVVMYVALDTSDIYGSKTVSFNLQVNQLESKINTEDTYYIDQKLEIADPLSQELSILPNLQGQELVFEEDTFTFEPCLRLPLDKDYFQTFVNDSLNYQNDTTVADYIKGLAIQGQTANSVLGISPNLNFSSTTPVNKIAVFYTDTVPKVYLFPITGPRHLYLDNQTAGSKAFQSVDNASPEDDYFYVQGFNQYEVRLAFSESNFENWGNVIIKKAELEFYTAEDENPFVPIPAMLLDVLDEDDERSLVIDIERIVTAGLDLNALFGGVLTEEEIDNTVVKKYTMNITQYFSQLVEENTMESDSVVINARSPLTVPERSIILGPQHEEYPMKLKVLYSLPK